MSNFITLPDGHVINADHVIQCNIEKWVKDESGNLRLPGYIAPNEEAQALVTPVHVVFIQVIGNACFHQIRRDHKVDAQKMKLMIDRQLIQASA